MNGTELYFSIFALGFISGAFTMFVWLRLSHDRKRKAKSIVINRNERQQLDTQKNVYGRICNALAPLGKQYERHGVKVYPLGTQGDGTCLINIFWANEFHSMGILSITVGRDFLAVISLQAPCPQGRERNYRTDSLTESSVTKTIIDVQRFITETYVMAYQFVRECAR